MRSPLSGELGKGFRGVLQPGPARHDKGGRGGPVSGGKRSKSCVDETQTPFLSHREKHTVKHSFLEVFHRRPGRRHRSFTGAAGCRDTAEAGLERGHGLRAALGEAPVQQRGGLIPVGRATLVDQAVHHRDDQPSAVALGCPDIGLTGGIGETGLDYYRLGNRTVADMEWQRSRFRIHIQAAQQTQLPLVIHTRSSSGDTVAILKEQGEDGSAGSAGGVFHCFTETADVARAGLDLGLYISFSGILTFKNAQDLRDVAQFVPMDRILIETDSPYLAPVPHRGKTNNPSYVPFVAKQIAEIKGMSVEAVAEATSRNFDQLFSAVLK